MKNQIITYLSAILVCSGTVTPVQSMEIEKRAYQAEYELSGPAGKSTHILSFDGKGHGRSEMLSASGRKSVSIIDYGRKQVQVIMPDTKSCISMPLSDDYLENLGSLSARIKSTGKSLGSKTISGHICTGTHYTLDGGAEEEIWTGNDIGGIRVYSIVKGPGSGVSEAKLKTFVPGAPAEASFRVPAVNGRN